jgi:uncharacterized membrane protein YcjF (UPF0283 family)
MKPGSREFSVEVNAYYITVDEDANYRVDASEEERLKNELKEKNSFLKKITGACGIAAGCAVGVLAIGASIPIIIGARIVGGVFGSLACVISGIFIKSDCWKEQKKICKYKAPVGHFIHADPDI